MRLHTALLGMQLCAVAVTVHAQAVPAELRGSWKIVQVLPAAQTHPCWSAERAKRLIGTTLYYQGGAMVWHGGAVSLTGTVKRTLSAREYEAEYKATFAELGMHAASITEYDLQHEDADVTGATTEVPGDTVVLAGPGRLVVQACGVFYAAVRTAAAPAVRR